MSKWGKLFAGLRFAVAVAATKGLKIKGVPVKVIAEEVEKGAKRIKAAKPTKPSAGSTGE